MSLIPETVEGGQEQTQGSGQETAPDRPEFVEAQFWDADNKQVRVKEMAKALSDTQTQLRNKTEDIRKEIEESLKKGRPEAPTGYKVENLNIPEESGFEIPEDDKLIERFRQFAFDVGMTNEQFQQAVSIYANNIIEGIPNQAKEMEALGENARTRIDSLVHKAKAALSDEEFQTFQGMAMTAKDIEVLEKLTRDNRSGPSSFDRVEPQPKDLKVELDKLMSSDAYWRGDKLVQERATEISEQLARISGRA